MGDVIGASTKKNSVLEKAILPKKSYKKETKSPRGVAYILAQGHHHPGNPIGAMDPVPDITERGSLVLVVVVRMARTMAEVTRMVATRKSEQRPIPERKIKL